MLMMIQVSTQLHEGYYSVRIYSNSNHMQVPSGLEGAIESGICLYQLNNW